MIALAHQFGGLVFDTLQQEHRFSCSVSTVFHDYQVMQVN